MAPDGKLDPIASLESLETLDPSVLEPLTRLEIVSPGLIERIKALFLSESQALVSGIATAVQARDDASICAKAHSLRGSSATIGAKRLAGICRRLEELGASVDLAGAEILLGLLNQEYAQVHHRLAEGMRPCAS